MQTKVKITINGRYNYSVTLEQSSAFKFLKDLAKKHKNSPHTEPKLKVSIKALPCS